MRSLSSAESPRVGEGELVLPPGLLVSFYGDDFTGSTDSMEVLSRAGLRTALFVDMPGPEDVARIPGLRAVGLAGVSRSLSPAAMEAELPSLFAGMKALDAPLFHVKVCSTFDSSPRIGSIGRTIELALRQFDSAIVPLVVGAPALNRFCVFGNLFARSGPESEIFRLDRHPTMSRHPVTPMHESDLRAHLALQTDLRTGLVSALDLDAGPKHVAQRVAEFTEAGSKIALFDTLTQDHLAVVGRELWRAALADPPLLVVGSSGVEYALCAFWRQSGILPESPRYAAGPVDQILVVSGSCSPVTDRQIGAAVESGFAEIALDPSRLVHEGPAGAAIEQTVGEILRALETGRSVVAHTCRGPDDPRLTASERLGAAGDSARTGAALGRSLGSLARAVLRRRQLKRLIVAGGDTSGHAARALGIIALEMAAPMAPGSPLCRVSSSDPSVDGLEIVFKGGQVGAIDLFEAVRRGDISWRKEQR